MAPCAPCGESPLKVRTPHYVLRCAHCVQEVVMVIKAGEDQPCPNRSYGLPYNCPDLCGAGVRQLRVPPPHHHSLAGGGTGSDWLVKIRLQVTRYR